MTDLTERLAAKLGDEEIAWLNGTGWIILDRIESWLPLLLSEPELVAGLAPEVQP